MKKTLTLFIFLTAMAAQAKTLSCHDFVGQMPTGVSNDVAISKDATGLYQMDIQSCSGIVLWNCMSGQDLVVNETHIAVISDGTNFYSDRGFEFIKNDDGSYRLISPDLAHTFAATSCSELGD